MSKFIQGDVAKGQKAGVIYEVLPQGQLPVCVLKNGNAQAMVEPIPEGASYATADEVRALISDHNALVAENNKDAKKPKQEALQVPAFLAQAKAPKSEQKPPEK